MIVHGTQTMEQLDLGKTRLSPPTDAIWYRSTFRETKPVYYNGHECIIIKPGEWAMGSKNFVKFLKSDPESPFKNKECIETAEPVMPKSDPFEAMEDGEPETPKAKVQKDGFIEWPKSLPSIQEGWDGKLLIALAGALPEFDNSAFPMAHIATKAKMLKEYCEKNGIVPEAFPKVKITMHGGIM